MDWILDHLQIVIAIAAAVAYWLNQARKGASSDEEAGDQPAFPATPGDESEDAERARRIREEIRRKIAERARGAQTRLPERETLPPPLFGEEPMAPKPVMAPMAEPRNDWQTSRVLERQEKLREQMEELERARRQEPARSMAPMATASLVEPMVTPNPVGLSMRDDLRSKSGLRRAIVLREVLGPPVGLR